MLAKKIFLYEVSVLITIASPLTISTTCNHILKYVVSECIFKIIFSLQFITASSKFYKSEIKTLGDDFSSADPFISIRRQKK